MALTINNIQATADNIWIEPDLQNAQHVRDSGIVIPQRKDNKGRRVDAIPKSGIVKAKGPAVDDAIQIGDRVLLNIVKPDGIRLNRDEGYLLVKPEQILGKVEKAVHVA